MQRIRAIWRPLDLRCVEAASLLSQALDRELPRRDRVGVSLHLVSCAACRRYGAQLRFLRRALRRLVDELEDPATPPPPTLPPDVRERLKQALRRR